MVRPGWKEAQLKEVLSELGIFGYVIGDKDSISHNKQVQEYKSIIRETYLS